MYACSSSSAFAFVVLSRLDRLRKSTTTLGSDIELRSGGSETYASGDELVPKTAGDEEPKAEPNPPKAVFAALALLACALPRFMVVVCSSSMQRNMSKEMDWR